MTLAVQTRTAKAMFNGRCAEHAVFDCLTDSLPGFKPYKQHSMWLGAKRPTNSIVLHRPLDEVSRVDDFCLLEYTLFKRDLMVCSWSDCTDEQSEMTSRSSERAYQIST